MKDASWATHDANSR